MTRLRQSLAGLGLTCILLGNTAPHAVAAPDPRLVTHRYNPDEVVRINGKTSVQASIAFAGDEHIENIAIGDSNAWQVTPNKRANMLFVKPLAASARTNMTVITDSRTYYFDLVAAPQAQALYLLRFTYPEAPRPAAAPVPAGGPALTAEEGALAEGTVRISEPTTPDPASLNFAWDRKGKASLIPARVYDDGQSVYLSWSPGVPVPAILVRDANGAEGPVNYAVRGETIVIEGTPRLLLLRSGRDMATLENKAPARPRSEAAPSPSLATQTVGN